MKNLKKLARMLNGICLDYRSFKFGDPKLQGEKQQFNILAFQITINLKKLFQEKPMTESRLSKESAEIKKYK